MVSWYFCAHLLLLAASSTAVPTSLTHPTEAPDPCDLVKCPVGSSCEIYEPTGETFCQPSCKLDNGGCQDNETCEMVTVQCIRAPCPPLVNCIEKKDPCSVKECPKGTVCRVFLYTGEAVCYPTCSVDNGGCDDDQQCILALPACAYPPVKPCIGFVTCVDIDPCSLIYCPPGSACKVLESTGEAFCEPSCELQNGGCDRNQTCELMDVTCVREPCPPVVICKAIDCKLVECPAVACPYPNPADPEDGVCCKTCPPVDCRLVLCAFPTCPNPIPADPQNGRCCPTCPPPVDCSLVRCADPPCLNPLPADPENGICCRTCPPVDCSVVLCEAPACPDPIPADIENGKCCPTCPPGSSCPIAGQFFQSCGSACPATCDNPNPICTLQCVPGCHCPPGQVIDTVGKTCFTLDECPDTDICDLPLEIGPCLASFPRYYYNSHSGKCEKFYFGGCHGNKNNFQTLDECRRACEPKVDCSAVLCPVPTCPNPILPNPAKGECCSVCPPGSTCPVKGQIYAQCKGCPVTCSNHDELIFCPAICIPGCRCPTGQVIDEQTNACVIPEKCTPTCELRPDPGPCEAAIKRYFYNSTSKLCETFIYGGCQGNDNNFDSLANCELECSECSPTCTPEFCKAYPKSQCNMPPGTPREIPGCFGNCDETVCNACYYSKEPLSLPPLEDGCPNMCPVDSTGVISDSSCLNKWGKCVKDGCLKTYGKSAHKKKKGKTFRCWRPSCPLRG